MSADQMDIDTPAEQQQPETPTTNKPKKKRFEVKRWTAVAFWTWDQNNETCAICRNHLMEPCIECASSATAAARGTGRVNCPRAVGTCNHSFHLHCIETWIAKRNSCPLDNSEWSVKELLKS